MELHKRDESPTKLFVDVYAVHRAATGRIEPWRIKIRDGLVLVVSRILDERRAASLRAGGQGMRYQCRVANDTDGAAFVIYLFHDGNYWFIEQSTDGGDIVCADGTIQRLTEKRCKTLSMP